MHTDGSAHKLRLWAFLYRSVFLGSGSDPAGRPGMTERAYAAATTSSSPP
jgi:hypothetical protein